MGMNCRPKAAAKKAAPAPKKGEKEDKKDKQDKSQKDKKKQHLLVKLESEEL